MPKTSQLPQNSFIENEKGGNKCTHSTYMKGLQETEK